MDRVRARVKDKRVLRLVKAFLKAGILTELGEQRGHLDRHAAGRHLVPADWPTSRCRCSMSTCMAPWKPGGAMSTPGRRSDRRSKGRPKWRVVRYADDFVDLGARFARGTPRRCARTSPACWHRWVCGCHRPRPRSCT